MVRIEMLLASVVACSGLASCDRFGDAAARPTELGSGLLSLPATTVRAAGMVYRIAGTLLIAGPQNDTVYLANHYSMAFAKRYVSGEYTLSVTDLEVQFRADDGLSAESSSWQRAQARWAPQNPLAFTIARDEEAVVAIQVQVGDMTIASEGTPPAKWSVTQASEVLASSVDTDILFIIDNSNSMLEEQVELVRNAGPFVESLTRSENRYRVGFVSTSLFASVWDGSPQDPSTYGGHLQLSPASSADLASAGCNGIGPNDSLLPYLVGPDPEDPQAEAKRCRLVEDFKKTVKALGIRGSNREAGLEAARRALDPVAYEDIANANKNFLRPEADLTLIFLTDEDDCSFESYDAVDGSTISQCYALADQAIDPGFYVDFFAGVKQQTRGIRAVRAALIAGGVVDQQGKGEFVAAGCFTSGGTSSAECGCWTSWLGDDFFCELLDNGVNLSCPDTDSCTTLCGALPATRYSRFIDILASRRREAGLTRGVYQDSICKPKYDDTLKGIIHTAIVENCSEWVDAYLGLAETVQLVVRRTHPSTGEVTEDVLPRYGTDADCQSCEECGEEAWEYTAEGRVCLACGMQKTAGDSYHLRVTHEVIEPENLADFP